MAYERISKPDGPVYHYTSRKNLPHILQDGCLRRMCDIECWMCGSLEDTLKLMRQTVMLEGKPFYKVGGALGYYPTFVPEDYVILKLKPRFQSGEWVRWNQELPPDSPPELLEASREFNRLKLGYRGDLKFREHPEVIEAAPLCSGQAQQIKSVVDNVVFPAIDLVLTVFFFAKLGTTYFDYRKHGQFEWAAPAILFASLVFTLTAPLYVWQILGM